MGEDRSSYSKTDTNATFMRMKEDHMQKGQKKRAYNLRIVPTISLLPHTVFIKKQETQTPLSHVEQIEKEFGQKPEVITASAGYASEENYQTLENKYIIANKLFYNKEKGLLSLRR
jgi:hypothetical protein